MSAAKTGKSVLALRALHAGCHLMPTVAFAMVAYRGDIYYGLWFPVIVALMTAVIGALFLNETRDVDIGA
jgi:hypothetical protein